MQSQDCTELTSYLNLIVLPVTPQYPRKTEDLKIHICFVCPAGLFKLTDPSGLPAGHIELTLKWKYMYVLSSDGIKASKEPLVILNERPGQLTQELPGWQDVEGVEVQEEEEGEEKASKDHPHVPSSPTMDAVSQVIRHCFIALLTLFNFHCSSKSHFDLVTTFPSRVLLIDCHPMPAFLVIATNLWKPHWTCC